MQTAENICRAKYFINASAALFNLLIIDLMIVVNDLRPRY